MRDLLHFELIIVRSHHPRAKGLLNPQFLNNNKDPQNFRSLHLNDIKLRLLSRQINHIFFRFLWIMLTPLKVINFLHILI